MRDTTNTAKIGKCQNADSIAEHIDIMCCKSNTSVLSLRFHTVLNS